MYFRFKRVESAVTKPVLGTTWLSDCRLLFLDHKPIGRVLVGKFSGHWGGVLYLTITSEPDLLRRDNRLTELAPGLYVDILPDSHVTEGPEMDFKPGVREIHEFLRKLQTKRVRKDRENEWRIRSNTIRKIIDVADRIDSGRYEIFAYDPNDPKERFNAIDEALTVPQETDELLVRTPDTANGGISIKEANLFVQHIAQYRQHAVRTQEVDVDRVTEKIGKFYRLFGLEAPPVVILPNPLSATIAGNFATVLLYSEKHGIDASDFEQRTNKTDLFSKYITKLMFTSASWSTQQAMDELTFRSVVNLIERDFITNRFADDALRILRNEIPRQVAGDFAELETTYVDPSWTISPESIQDAINVVLSNPIDFARNSQKKKLIALIKHMAKSLSKGDGYLEQLLMRFRLAGTDVLLESSIPTVVSFGMNVLGLKLPIYELYGEWENLVLEGAGFVMHRDFCFVSNFPEFIEMDERNRLHCQTGPAIKWRDGWCVNYWHGVSVPKWVIESPEKITIETINAATNQEFRRVMIEQYGVGRYLIDSGATELQRDKFGVLYCQRIDQGEPLSIVRVINSTPEPDGTYKEYFLRVPPHMRSAEEAVAWTFGLEPDDYNPIVET